MPYRHRFHHPRRHRRHHHHIRVALIIGGDGAVELIPNGVIHMAATQNVGQTTSFSIAYMDQNGQPMVPMPTPDAPPAWSQSDSAVDTLTAAADGNTASAFGLAPGTETIAVSLAVGGQSFSATIDMTVVAVVPTQTLTSIEIVASPPV
jgi:hypothetical protein